jgi:NTE family protein
MSTALVLAGGGVTGIAWETGVLLGLRDGGIDLTAGVDTIIGTSAGSTVGAQLALGTDLEAMYARQLDENHGEISPWIDVDLLTEIFGLMTGGGTSDDATRREIGRLALGATTVDEATRRAVIAHRIGTDEWPAGRLVVTAIDADSGEFVTWDSSSGVSLVDAVASSCAVPGVWPCVTINGRRYYDGGLRNSANAHLAAGHQRVWLLAPLTGGASDAVDLEVSALRATGSAVRVINADADAIAAMGPNSLDPRFRAAAAEHGRRQGLAHAARG